MTERFKAETLHATNGKIFIDKALYDIPVSVGDRSSSIQDASAALQGTRFQIEGDAVRLFMQWGVGLKALLLIKKRMVKTYLHFSKTIPIFAPAHQPSC